MGQNKQITHLIRVESWLTERYILQVIVETTELGIDTTANERWGCYEKYFNELNGGKWVEKKHIMQLVFCIWARTSKHKLQIPWYIY